ncbi:PREDICTED: uncharacterized protein LOC106747294 [Dinoponera quadriceps]|uniref:Uncharacterized protein LOC106747294 n=1 Tax=Dinoponera quadriceps TaxID=609295 RepID=A0A6P3XNV3_DINQU|nr:PREDICTED: uncharacterized protein LOC106747294 [Dinoponera quadriceps]
MQQCIAHGLSLTRIHRALRFAQSPWLRGYVELNTGFRIGASNAFENNLYKLMNNAVFGRTMENVREHLDVRLVTRWDGRYGAEALIAKPNFHSRSIFSEDLMAVELRRLRVQFTKPIYVGMYVLEISKTRVYEFHYDYMLPLYRHIDDNNTNNDSLYCRLLYTDTDSLIYHIVTNTTTTNSYECMWRTLLRFDYPTANAYDMPRANNCVPGLVKDENCGAVMSEFVGLRTKVYTYRVDNSFVDR